MTWTVGLIESAWIPLSQNDPSLTVDGQPMPDAPFMCAQTGLAMMGRYVSGMKRWPDEAHDEMFGERYVGPSDIPDIRAYTRNWMSADFDEAHVYSPRDCATAIYNALYWKRPVLWLASLDQKQAHWECITSMTGGGTPNPFDTLNRSEPWTGQFPVATDWETFVSMLWKYYADGSYVVLALNRVRSIIRETRLGPQ